MDNGDRAVISLTDGIPLTKAQRAEGADKGAMLYVIGANNIVGTRYSDTITGNGLDNIINAGRGTNVLSGGGGADIFVVDQGTNTITDADAGDRLVIKLRGSSSDQMLKLTGGAMIMATVDGKNGKLANLESPYYEAYFHPVVPNPMSYSVSPSNIYPSLDPLLGETPFVRYQMIGKDLMVRVFYSTSQGVTEGSSTLVKDYEPGDLGLKFNQVVVPNYAQASSRGNKYMKDLVSDFKDVQSSYIEYWTPPPGLNDLWPV